jgi:ribosomal protein S6
MAYEIKKFKDGFVTSYLLKLFPSSIDAFKRACHLNEDVLRLALIHREDWELTDAGVLRSNSERERPRTFVGGGGNRPNDRF